LVIAVPGTAHAVAASVTDPELPMLTLEDLGVLRRIEERGSSVTITITPTYSGCPALATMRDDLVRRLTEAGYADVTVEIALTPAWSSDWISERGRSALAAAGISPPGQAPTRSRRAPLTLSPTRRKLRCPRCESAFVELTSEFGATACRALYRCTNCLEPFEHLKEI
jgi:ring-1,2-phenylacetyl-CoA epoxidase subunit PaaD